MKRKVYLIAGVIILASIVWWLWPKIGIAPGQDYEVKQDGREIESIDEDLRDIEAEMNFDAEIDQLEY